jgi:hypothetical protein
MRMLRSCLILVLLWPLADVLGTVVAAEQITFVFRGQRQGQRSYVVSDYDLSLTYDLKQGEKIIQSVDQKRSRSQKKLVTVLAAGDDGPTKVKVEYRTAEESDGSETKKDLTVGKTYLVVRDGEKLRVTDTAGKLSSDKEAQIVAADHRDLGRRFPLAKILDGKRITVGNCAEFDAEKARQLMNIPATVGKVDRFAITLTGTRQQDGIRCAVFDIEIQIRSEGINSVIDVKGEYLVAIDSCQLVSLNLTGPVTISGKRQNVTVAGRGTLRISTSVRYEKKK